MHLRRNFGVELSEKAFNLQVGYNFRRTEELRLTEQRNFSGHWVSDSN
jgi:hypothetical protein